MKCVNDTHRGKLCLTQFGATAASYLFHMFTKSIMFTHSIVAY